MTIAREPADEIMSRQPFLSDFCDADDFFILGPDGEQALFFAERAALRPFGLPLRSVHLIEERARPLGQGHPRCADKNRLKAGPQK